MATSEATFQQLDRAHNEANEESDYETLVRLISIWPILSNVTVHLPVGDLISLSRTSTALRTHTHGFPPPSDAVPSSLYDEHLPDSSSLSDHLLIGRHQTSQWKNLKALAPFTCSFPSHKEPKSTQTNPCGPCKFCSRPICRTCIVRSFFMNPKTSKDTYRYRTRHLCQTCWDTGNLRKDYRFPPDTISREKLWNGRGYAYRGHWCACSASEDNWVCGECRILQNSSGQRNLALSDASTTSATTPSVEKRRDAGALANVQCYGLNCVATIREVDRDRRRICLWCSKPLMRQYGGEDRLRWEEKQVEIRAASAASRSADIKEWARNRFRTLTMSRREMRGTAGCVEFTGSDDPEHDRPIFVRHLDALNYRKFMDETSAPSPDSVYKSKHGRWVYSIAFLERFSSPMYAKALSPPPAISGTEIFNLTRQDGLQWARRSVDIQNRVSFPMFQPIFIYATQFREAGILNPLTLDWAQNLASEDDEILGNHEISPANMKKLIDRLFAHLSTWEHLSDEAFPFWQPPVFATLLIASGIPKHVIEKKPAIVLSDENFDVLQSTDAVRAEMIAKEKGKGKGRQVDETTARDRNDLSDEMDRDDISDTTDDDYDMVRDDDIYRNKTSSDDENMKMKDPPSPSDAKDRHEDPLRPTQGTDEIQSNRNHSTGPSTNRTRSSGPGVSSYLDSDENIQSPAIQLIYPQDRDQSAFSETVTAQMVTNTNRVHSNESREAKQPPPFTESE